jgi:hypothetical protein
MRVEVSAQTPDEGGEGDGEVALHREYAPHAAALVALSQRVDTSYNIPNELSQCARFTMANASSATRLPFTT